jgi:hypothetical protein
MHAVARHPVGWLVGKHTLFVGVLGERGHALRLACAQLVVPAANIHELLATPHSCAGPILTHANAASKNGDEESDDACSATCDDNDSCCSLDEPWLTQQAVTMSLSVWLALLTAASLCLTLFW